MLPFIHILFSRFLQVAVVILNNLYTNMRFFLRQFFFHVTLLKISFVLFGIRRSLRNPVLIALQDYISVLEKIKYNLILRGCFTRHNIVGTSLFEFFEETSKLSKFFNNYLKFFLLINLIYIMQESRINFQGYCFRKLSYYRQGINIKNDVFEQLWSVLRSQPLTFY